MTRGSRGESREVSPRRIPGPLDPAVVQHFSRFTQFSSGLDGALRIYGRNVAERAAQRSLSFAISSEGMIDETPDFDNLPFNSLTKPARAFPVFAAGA